MLTFIRVCVPEWEHPGSRSIPWHWKLSYLDSSIVCVRVYKAETFFGLPSIVSLPLPYVYTGRAVFNISWHTLGTNPDSTTHKYVGECCALCNDPTWGEGGDCVCLLKLVRPPHTGLSVPIVAYQTSSEQMSEPLTRACSVPKSPLELMMGHMWSFKQWNFPVAWID